MNQNWSAKSIAFNSGASSFNLGSTGGYTLTTYGGGVTNNSSSAQTISSAVTLGATQTWVANSGALNMTGPLATGGYSITFDGSYNTSVSGVISGGWNSLYIDKTGTGTLTLSGSNTFGNSLNVEAGTVLLANNSALGSNTQDTVASGATLELENNISVTENSITIAGSGVSGAGAIGNLSGNNTLNAQTILSGAATIASTSGTLTLANAVSIGNNALTLGGAGNVTSSNQIYGTGGNVTISGSGTVTASTLNLQSGSLSLAGSGQTNLTGGSISAANISITGNGNQTISSTFNLSGNFTQSGGGTTTLSGSSANTINGTTSITGGTVLLDKTSGTALGGTISVSGSGTLGFGASNQLASYTNVTLGTGGTIDMDGTTQSLNTLTVTGNSVIDFGDESASLTIASLDITGSSTLTVENWNQSVDTLYITSNPGSSLNNVIFEPGNLTAKWNSSGGSVTPAPEPRFYGALFIGLSVAALCLYRRIGIDRGSRILAVMLGDGASQLDQKPDQCGKEDTAVLRGTCPSNRIGNEV